MERVEGLYREYLKAMEEYAKTCGEELKPACNAVVTYLTRPQLLLEKLIQLATGYGGCVSCTHSAVLPHHPMPETRTCTLGLRQDTCNRWTPMLKTRDEEEKPTGGEILNR